MLCVVSVVTTMVIGANIGVHYKALIGVQTIGVTLDSNGGPMHEANDDISCKHKH